MDEHLYPLLGALTALILAVAGWVRQETVSRTFDRKLKEAQKNVAETKADLKANNEATVGIAREVGVALPSDFLARQAAQKRLAEEELKAAEDAARENPRSG